MLTTILIVFAGVVLILVVIRFWLNGLESKSKTSDELVAWLKQLGQQVQTSQQSVDQKLSRNMELFNNRLDNASFVMA
jgi:hypothetical protein